MRSGINIELMLGFKDFNIVLMELEPGASGGPSFASVVVKFEMKKNI